MAAAKSIAALFKRGDKVKILSSPGLFGHVESRVSSPVSRLSGGPNFYRVKLRCPAPRPKYKVVREDHLELEIRRATKIEADPLLPRALRNNELSEAEFERIMAAAEGDTGSGVLRRKTSSLPSVQ